MAKRVATRELNHDNWDDEDEPEEAGSFQVASSDTLQSRVIKQAKRRLAPNQSQDKPSLFSGFSGFGKIPQAASANSSPFSFLAQSPSSNAKVSENGSKESEKKEESNGDQEYLTSLKALNETVTTWIADHVKKNPYCVLTPVFKDYEKYLNELEKKKKEKKSDKLAENLTEEKKAEPQPSLFQFGQTGNKPSGLNLFSSLSSSSSSSATTTSTAASTFSFGLNKLGTTTQSSSPFSFSFQSKPMPSVEEKDEGGGDAQEEGDDEDAPPKVEVKQVQEDDAFYSIRCKLFYKKDNSYQDKGVGMLHLKKAANDKTQLVVRADTSLGNILLNIVLNSQLPTERVGKNNVMLVCVPNPPIDPKNPSIPTPMLIRVKTDQEADELFAKLNDAKK